MKKYSDEEISKIKESAKIILDMINECPGGSSWLDVNGKCLGGDIGYAMEFCQEILEFL